MSPKPVYSIVAYGGHWANEDDWEKTIAASYCKRSIANEIKRLEEEVRFVNELNEKVKIYRTAWMHARPFVCDYELEQIPRWPAGLHMNAITTEMREERKAIEARNDAKNVAYQNAYTAHHQEIEKACTEFRESLEYSDEIKTSKVDLDTKYRMEEIGWLPPDKSVLQEAETRTGTELDTLLENAATDWIHKALVEIRNRRFPDQDSFTM